jgi:hypothetical protein
MGSNQISLEEMAQEGAEILKEVLNDFEIGLLRKPESCSAKRYCEENLSAEERSIITTGAKDMVILAIAGRMMRAEPERFKRFDNYIAKSMYAGGYMDEQRDWLGTEVYLHGGRMDTIEAIEDSRKYGNPERFRAYYFMKHPYAMKANGSSSGPHPAVSA